MTDFTELDESALSLLTLEERIVYRQRQYAHRIKLQQDTRLAERVEKARQQKLRQQRNRAERAAENRRIRDLRNRGR